MKMIFFLTAFLMAVTICRSQSFTGRVMHDTVPLAGATIEIKKQRIVTVSDQEGFFSIKGLQPGNYTLHISMIGYETFHESIHVNGDLNRTRIFDLVPVNTALDAVVVTGTMKPVQKKESPILVEVYTPQFLKKNPVPSIFEALQNVNGVRPQLNCNVCNTGDIHINGLEGPYTMITIDGMPIVSSLASVYGLFGIPTQLIDRIEIVKGPASGLYGSEAIGGLINIITKSPDKAPAFTFNAMSTSWLEHSIDAGAKFRVGKKSS